MSDYSIDKRGKEICTVLGIDPRYVLQDGFTLEPSGDDLIVRWQGRARLYRATVEKMFGE